MSVWQNDWDWNADDVGLEAAFQNFASNFFFGYSSYNLTSGRYTYMSEDSYDLYNPDHELTEEEQATLEALVREFIKGYEKDENFTLRKVASDQPEILDLGARFDELVWVYNPEDDKLVIAP